MTSRHITRDFSAHRKSVIRPYDEYCGLEIFSFDPQYTRTYLPESNTLKVKENGDKTSWKSWSCYKSSDMKNDMEFSISYNVKEYGEYRIDLLYEQSNHLHSEKKRNTGADLTGEITISSPNKTIRDETVLFVGENNVIKRKSFYNKPVCTRNYNRISTYR